MSLHTLAHHLQTAGRGNDSVLVHMTPGEVSGLQSLAMAHGGSLTINPHTGLPEAGFLSAILPVVASAAATAMGVPISPMQMAAATTVIGTATSGSLMKGLQMGMGAYGGASLAQGFMGPTGAEGAVAGSPAISSADAALRAGQNIGGAFASTAAPASTFGGVTPNFANVAQNAGAMNPTADAIARASGTYTQPLAPPLPNPVNTLNQGQAAYADFMRNNPTPVVASSLPASTPGATSVENATMIDKLKSLPSKAWDMLGSGPEAEKERKEFYDKYKIPLAASGLSILGLSREEPRAPKQQASGYQNINPAYYSYMQNRPGQFADGGLASLPVEQMSQQASVGANTNYPMANLRPYGYAVPRNVPISENVFKPADYERTDPYTGEAKFAGGGLAALHFKAGGTFVSQLKPVAEPKKATPKLQDTSKLEKQVSSLEKYSGLDDAQNRINDINNQLKGLNKKAPDYKTTSAQLNKDLKTAQTDLKNYNAYKSAASKFDAAKAANDKATNAANQQYEDAMSKYNDYQNKLADEKKTWEEQTSRKATGLQGIKPQTTTRAAVPTKEGTFTPTLAKDASGKYVATKDLPPVTEFKKFGSLKEANAALINKNPITVQPEDVEAIFQNTLGRRPTKSELDKLVGLQSSTLAIAQFAEKQPDFKAKAKYNDDDLKDAYKYYIGKEPNAGDLAALQKANAAGKITNFQQLRNAITNRPAYLENINAVAQAAFTDQQKAEAAAKAEAERQATSMNVDDVFSTYTNVLGRAPNKDELNQYIGAHETVDSLVGKLKSSDEYLNKLTQGAKGSTYSAQPSNIATSFTPATTTAFTPATTPTTGIAALPTTTTTPLPVSVTSPGAATGLSGLETPAGRGTVNVEGAYPIAPDWYNKQIGIQDLATQAAAKAAPLQGGLSFAAPTQQTSPQSIEALLAALRAQQAQQGQAPIGMAMGGMAEGGYNLGGYSDGGRLLKGPGDGVSDSIPASIGDRQPARLADGEFVIPARIVSEIGNGSTDAGARKLYAMMHRIQQARSRTVGKDKVAVKSGADKMLPA